MSRLGRRDVCSKRKAMPVRHFALIPIVALGAAALSGCAGGNEDAAAKFFVAPGKFALFNCQQIAQQSEENLKRQHELEALMVQAGPGSGQVVSAVAYRPEYLTLRGQLTDLRAVAAEKNCKFVPGESRDTRALDPGALR
jgi:hypothetical protein